MAPNLLNAPFLPLIYKPKCNRVEFAYQPHEITFGIATFLEQFSWYMNSICTQKRCDQFIIFNDPRYSLSHLISRTPIMRMSDAASANL